MAIEFLDPTHEADAGAFALAERLGAAHATIGIVSNGKKGTRPFFDALEAALLAHSAVGKVERVTKANYSAPMEPEIIQQAERWQALVSGVGD